MQTVHLKATSSAEGQLTISIPNAQPNEQYDVVLVLQQRSGVKYQTMEEYSKLADEIRERLAASGRTFGDSVEDLRELREERMSQW